MTNSFIKWTDVVNLRSGKKIWPSFVDFHTSNKCNQNCLGCAYGGTLDGEMMTEAFHFEIVDQLIDVGVKAFDFAGGGEPTCLPYLSSLMNHIASRDAHYGLITNGVMLNDFVIWALVREGTYVRFSLEASCKEDYSKYKNCHPDSWNWVLNNIRRLMDTKKVTKSDLQVGIKFAVGNTLQGRKHYERALDLGVNLGVDRVTIKALTHYPEQIPDRQFFQEESILRDVLDDNFCPCPVSYWILPWAIPRIPQCWLNPLHCSIDHFGNVYICCYFYDNRKDELLIGNLHERSFADIWMDDKHWEKVKQIDKRNCSRVLCKFFKHNEAVNEAMIRGRGEFL